MLATTTTMHVDQDSHAGSGSSVDQDWKGNPSSTPPVAEPEFDMVEYFSGASTWSKSSQKRRSRSMGNIHLLLAEDPKRTPNSVPPTRGAEAVLPGIDPRQQSRFIGNGADNIDVKHTGIRSSLSLKTTNAAATSSSNLFGLFEELLKKSISIGRLGMGVKIHRSVSFSGEFRPQDSTPLGVRRDPKKSPKWLSKQPTLVVNEEFSLTDEATSTMPSSYSFLQPPNQQVWEWITPKYRVKGEIGIGSFGSVVLARNMETLDLCVVKRLSKASLNAHPIHLANLTQELNVMRTLQLNTHPNFVHFVEPLETETEMCIVMDFVESLDLFDYITADDEVLDCVTTGGDQPATDITFRPISITEIRHIFRELCIAVQHLHSLNIVHRDLKLENVLVITRSISQDEEAHLSSSADTFLPSVFVSPAPGETNEKHVFDSLKLIDFGFSKFWEAGKHSLLTDRCGSVEYAAPEIILQVPFDPRMADLWALGVILFALLTKELPFLQDGKNGLKSLYHRIALADYAFPAGYTTRRDPEDATNPAAPVLEAAALDLCKKILAHSPKRRLDLVNILAHPFLAEPV